MPINPKTIDAAIKNCKTETTLNDGAQSKGGGTLLLIIRRRQDGVSAQWVGRWWVGKSAKKKTLGRYPHMTLFQAREECASQVRAALLDGKNPRAMAVQADKPTVSALFKAYCDQMDKDAAYSAKEVRRCLDRAAADIGAQRLACEIDPTDISHYLGKMFAKGKRSAADHHRAYLSAAFNFGIHATHDYRQELRRDWGIKVNPVTAVPKDTGASQARDRALAADELAQVWHAAGGPGFSLETGSAVRLLICTGQRVEELLRVEAHEVDLDAMVWRMPAHKTKMGLAPHDVPLPAVSLPVWRQLLAVTRRGLLFPGRTGKGMDHRAVNRSLGRWQATADMEHFQSRDLRRTWKSRAGDAGVDRFTRDLIQQHAQGDTGTKHYDRHDYGHQMREAMDKWSVWLSAALKQPGSALGQGGALDAQVQPQVAA